MNGDHNSNPDMMLQSLAVAAKLQNKYRKYLADSNRPSTNVPPIIIKPDS